MRKMIVFVLVFALQLLNSTTTLGLHTSTNTPSSSSSVHRRKLILAGGAAAAASCLPRRVDASVSSPFEQPSLRQSGGYAERVQGIGGGFDMIGDRKPIADIDILYPPSLNGTWVCERKVVSVEGDVNQAQGAWKLLGGTIPVGGGGGGREREDFQRVKEKYFVRFVELRRPTDAIIGLEGKKYYGVILDRGYEFEERTGSSGNSGSSEAAKTTVVQWDPDVPNTLKYERNDGSPATELKVVKRTVEPQNNQGSLVGSNELIRVTTKASALFGSNFDIMYATRVQRRWRRTTTDEGDRVVEGIEIQKSYRVLDGIAGIETPTSTVKSTLRLTRTYPTRDSTTTTLLKSDHDDDTTVI